MFGPPTEHRRPPTQPRELRLAVLSIYTGDKSCCRVPGAGRACGGVKQRTHMYMCIRNGPAYLHSRHEISPPDLHTDRTCIDLISARPVGHSSRCAWNIVLIEEGQASGPRRGTPERGEGRGESRSCKWRRWHPRPSKAARLGQDRPAFAADQAQACCGPPATWPLRLEA